MDGHHCRVALEEAVFLDPETIRRLALDAVEEVARLADRGLVDTFWVCDFEYIEVELVAARGAGGCGGAPAGARQTSNLVFLLAAVGQYGVRRARLAVETQRQLSVLDLGRRLPWHGSGPVPAAEVRAHLETCPVVSSGELGSSTRGTCDKYSTW